MPAAFWFSIRGTETYKASFRNPNYKNPPLDNNLDRRKEEEKEYYVYQDYTEEEYIAQEEGRYVAIWIDPSKLEAQAQVYADWQDRIKQRKRAMNDYKKGSEYYNEYKTFYENDKKAQPWNSCVHKERIWQKREKQSLQEVDELICEFMNQPKPSPDRDSYFYHICHDWGFWATMHTAEENKNKGIIDRTAIEWMLDNIMASVVKNLTEKEEELEKNYRELYGTVRPEMIRYKLEALFEWAFLKQWEFGCHG